ncbi:MAG TPA: FAD-dependent monooxygenase, partial [Gemmatirosa sp.]
MIFDVAVVGCGPVGALAANLTAGAGLSTLVIDREAEPHPLPRAVHLDHEMMRVFQAVGLADRLAPIMRETEGHLHVGADRGVIRYLGTAGRPRPFGWANDYFFYQPELEGVLRAGIARFAHAELRLGVALEGLEQDAEGVTLAVRAGEVRSTARARFVVACDGARSRVRRALGIPLDDLAFEEPWLVVDVEVDGPVRFPEVWGVAAGADLQQLSVMMCDPVRPATVVP